MYPESTKIASLVRDATNIVIIQADNPDGDSLGSALALEQIFHELGKKPFMYCGVEIPAYLRYMSGWDRVEKHLPSRVDLSIIVDASAASLLEKLQTSPDIKKVREAPCIILDHHASTANDIEYAFITLNDTASSSTGELIYHLAHELGWPLSVESNTSLMVAILGDTQGLSNSLTRSSTYRVMAEMADMGVDRPLLEEKRRSYSKMAEPIYRYKGELIARTELFHENTIAVVTIPYKDIVTYSAMYNPVPLIQSDMLQIENVRVAVVLKSYDDGKITGAIRCNPGSTIGSDLAAHFGGGGHPYASGFKLIGQHALDDVKYECISTAHEMLTNLNHTQDGIVHENL